jgi:hypothetical protein
MTGGRLVRDDVSVAVDDVDIDDQEHQAFRSSVETLVAEWRHRVIDLREPIDPVIDLRYLPEPIQAAAPVILDLRREGLSA